MYQANNIALATDDLCISIPSSGGIIGLFTSDRAAIEGVLKRYNADGYRLVGFTRESRANLLYAILQVLCLVCTLFLWCPASAGLAFFSRSYSPGLPQAQPGARF
jgi:hypothetical protein